MSTKFQVVGNNISGDEILNMAFQICFLIRKLSIFFRAVKQNVVRFQPKYFQNFGFRSQATATENLTYAATALAALTLNHNPVFFSTKPKQV